ncbi:hypothetical protein CsSME_00006966 [Camellia sinensis var. sinensis]
MIFIKELPGVWSQQADPSQWSSTYYGYGQGYDAYGYGTTHDPSLYAYGAYPGYAQTLFFPFCWMCCPDCNLDNIQLDCFLMPYL